jgi:hypothetical protein
MMEDDVKDKNDVKGKSHESLEGEKDTMDDNVKEKMLLRQMIQLGSVPICVEYDGNEYYRIVQRMSFFDALATDILRNNSSAFTFMTEDGRLCQRVYPVGVAIDALWSHVPHEGFPRRIKLYKHDQEQRSSFSKMFMSSCKHADYVNLGNTSRIDKLPKRSSERISTYVENSAPSLFSLSFFSLDKGCQREYVAIRYHFYDGTVVRKISMNDRIPMPQDGNVVIHGIPVPKELTGKDAVLFTDLDQWVHIIVRNGSLSSFIGSVTDRIRVQFLSAGATAMIKGNIVLVSENRTVAFCKEYISRKLLGGEIDGEKKMKMKSNHLYIYSDATFRVHDDELLHSLALGRKKLVLYYSLSEVW